MLREDTRWPGYYYRGDRMKLEDANWHCFTLSTYDRHTGNWHKEKAPVYHIVD
jgi:adenylylsulfate reductase subunit A